jgi:transcriptional regulator with XRE-family HTH domain
MDRLAGKQPLKRQFSVPAIARRIGTPLPQLKRIIRGQEEAPLAVLNRLARDLGLPTAELRAVLEEQGPVTGVPGLMPDLSNIARSGDPFRALEAGLIESARAFVALLRNCAKEGPPLGAKRGGRRTRD